MEPLFRIQKRAVRVIAGVPRNSPSNVCFESLNILKLEELHHLSFQTFMYKWYHNKLPPIFDEFLKRVTHHHATRLMHSVTILLKRPTDLSSGLGMRSIRYRGVLCHNHFSQVVSYNSSIHTYKKHLKRYLLEYVVDLLPYS